MFPSHDTLDFIIKKALIEIDAILEKLQSKIEAINQLTNDIKETFNSFAFVKQEEPSNVKLQ